MNWPSRSRTLLAGQFMECDACAAKLGHPVLCTSCAHNQVLIDELKSQTSTERGAYYDELEEMRSILDDMFSERGDAIRSREYLDRRSDKQLNACLRSGLTLKDLRDANRYLLEV